MARHRQGIGYFAVGDFVVVELRHVGDAPAADYIIAGEVTEVGDILGELAFKLDGKRIVLASDASSLLNLSR